MIRSADFFTKILCTGFEGFERIVCNLFKIFNFTLGAFQVDFDPVDCRTIIFTWTLLWTTLFTRTLFAAATAFLFRTALAAAATATATATATAKAESGSFGKGFTSAFAVGDFPFFENLFALFGIKNAFVFSLVAT